jgi:hypothetical protein
LPLNSTFHLPYHTICDVSTSYDKLIPSNGIGCCNLDSHADSCVARANFVVVEYTSKTVDVFGYFKELHSIEGIPIATVGTVWTQPTTGDSYLLVINQCVLFGPRLKNSLICSNQLRAHGVVVHDTPTQFDPKSKHAIIYHDLIIPLDMLGVVSYFESRALKSWEIDTLEQIVLMSDTNWESVSKSIPSLEICNPI